MTIYLMKLPNFPNPVIIDSKEYQYGLPSGLYLNFFRQWKEFEWIKKIHLTDSTNHNSKEVIGKE